MKILVDKNKKKVVFEMNLFESADIGAAMIGIANLFPASREKSFLMEVHTKFIEVAKTGGSIEFNNEISE